MRLAQPVGVAGVATWLPETSETAWEAVAAARLSRDEREEGDYRSLPVSVDHSAPQMAVLAARDALDSAGCVAGRVDVLTHAWTYYQGHDFWSPAHYVAAGIGADRAVPIGIQQMCNGAAAGVEVAVTRLLLDPELDSAVACTADRFTGPGFDRWSGDYGLWYGDGAAAAVLHAGRRAGDVLEILALETAAAPAMEDMHRGEDRFGLAPHHVGRTVSVRRTKGAFLEAGRGTEFASAVREQVTGVLGRCLAAAGVDGDDPRLRSVMLPRLGAKARGPYTEAVASLTPAPAVDLGARTGHLGAGDFLANLAALDGGEAGLQPGELALVLSAGAGFTWSAALVRRPVPTDDLPEGEQ